MSNSEVQPAAEAAPGLSQWQRVSSTFFAPSRTFADIKSGHRSWWLPFILIALAGYILFAAVSFKIGMQQVVDNQIRMNPKAEERLAQATPEQREMSGKISLYVTEGVFIANPLFALGGIALLSVGLWGTMNFLFAGKATYKSIFAMWMYAALPTVIKTLMGVIVIFSGIAPESFNIKNFSPTNAAAFLNPADTSAVLYSLLSSLDIITIWTLILLSIGAATVAGVKRSSGYLAVFGWWVVFILVGMGWAAAFG